ncbi:hypothetical protein GW17_00019473 [Ensete ventricosum]|nr:hypothetical protein GW17_00019473 [Ensete ventricosum]
MWTARYRAVPPKIDRRRSISAVGGRLKGEIDHRRSIEGEIDRRRSIEREKGRKKKKRKKKKKKERGEKRPVGHTWSSPVRRRRPRVAGALSPVRGERSRRRTVHTARYQYGDELGTPVRTGKSNLVINCITCFPLVKGSSL